MKDRPVYAKGRAHAQRMAQLCRSEAAEQCLTPKELGYITDYYALGWSMPEIARKHYICVSSVSRGIARAEAKLAGCDSDKKSPTETRQEVST